MAKASQGKKDWKISACGKNFFLKIKSNFIREWKYMHVKEDCLFLIIRAKMIMAPISTDNQQAYCTVNRAIYM